MHVRAPAREDVPAVHGAHPVKRPKKPAGQTIATGRTPIGGSVMGGIVIGGIVGRSGSGSWACANWTKTTTIMAQRIRN